MYVCYPQVEFDIYEIRIENNAVTIHYGLCFSYCKQFLTNSKGTTASISSLQIAIDMYFGTYCNIKQHSANLI